MTMRALVVEKDGGVSVREVPRPEIGEYEALVRMQASALCGTDHNILHNKMKNFADYPTILGHEGVGEVVETGAKVRGLKQGDMVVLPFNPDGLGGVHSTWGAIAEYGTVGDYVAMQQDGLIMGEGVFSDSNLAQRIVPPGIDPVPATMIVTFREVLSTMRRLGFKKGQELVVYGTGPVGLSFIRLAKLIGMGPIVVVVRSAEKAEIAKQAGADVTINSREEAVAVRLKSLFPTGAQNILDAAGVPELINENLALVKDYGQVCVYGVPEVNEYRLDWTAAPFSFDLRFAQWPSKEEESAVHDEIVAMMGDGRLDGNDYISDVFHFDDVLAAVEMFRRGENSKKVVIRF